MENKIKFYDGTGLLSQKDSEGLTPEIFMCQSNNSAGKTTWFSRFLIKKFKTKKELFMLIYRYNNELDGIGDQFWAPVEDLGVYPDDKFSTEFEIYEEDEEDEDPADKKSRKKKPPKKPQGYVKLYLNNELCGFAVALSNVEKNKKNSKVFNKVTRMFMDEFQTESNRYLKDEVKKLFALHKAVARGKGQPSRYVPVYMCSNPVTLLNPYYTAMGVVKHMQKGQRFAKGIGWVLEIGYNEGSAKALSESRFNLALSQEDPSYLQYSAQGVYLNDNVAFVEKLTGPNQYMMTVMLGGKGYAIRRYDQYGYVYCDNSPDLSYPVKLALTTDDHTTSSVLLAQSHPTVRVLRTLFERGLFRFKNLECKEVILKLLSY